MTDKWADYLITKVRFNNAKTHIDEVEVRADNGDTAGAPTKTKRSTVVSKLEAGYTYCTATLGSNNKWQKGAKVKIYTYDGQKFIKTRADGVKKDNLDNLPTF
ncbi:MAG TPA: DUF3892 domain-containing protein [Solirubrobacteraceae bacterium]|nr:DUF3892 domain-containing protein [Solirubrobacteraceae bacterium]